MRPPERATKSGIAFTSVLWKRAEAFAKLQELVPDVTEAEFDDLELAGKIDFL